MFPDHWVGWHALDQTSIKHQASGSSECGYCGRRELQSAPLALCSRCNMVAYCSPDCQMAHWRRKPGSHKEFCLTPEQRTPAAAQEANPKGDATIESECTIRMAQKAVSDLKACPSYRGELKELKPKETPEMKYAAAMELFRVMLHLQKQCKLSWAASHQRAMDKIIQAVKPEGDKGNARAQFQLGNLYDFGQGASVDFKKAAVCYTKSAEQGYSNAQSNLGCMHQFGRGVPQDYDEALRWYHMAAAQGNAGAQTNLGYMHQYGQGVPQDYKKALRRYTIAADQGFAKAQYQIGLMYEYGCHVPASEREAQCWFRKAADQGLADAAAKVKNI